MGVGSVQRKRERAEHLGPERRRPQVLDSARTIIVERGIAGVSMTAVADHMGVSKPVVYACFERRDDLLAALLAREERRLLEGVLGALPDPPSFEDPHRLLVEAFQALLETVAAEPDSWRVLFAAQPDPAVAERFRRGRALIAERVAGLAEPVLARAGTGDVPRKLPVLVELLMSSGEGAVRALLGSGEDWSAEELGTFVGGALFGALRSA